MYRLEKEEFTQYSYTILWAILAFQAGFLNAFGFIVCGRYVSHVTGFGTQIGIAVAQRNVGFALELIGFPVSFILGSWVNGILTSAKIDQGKKPRYDVVLILQPIIILLLIYLGRKGHFGKFAEELLDVRDFALLFTLVFVCGLQNACIATLTKGQIRTTHLTGISTDLGTDLARIMFGRLKSEEAKLNLKHNFSRIVTILAFAFGSILSVLESRRLEYTALWLPFISSVFIFVAIKRISHQLDIRHQRQVRLSASKKLDVACSNQ